MQYSAMGAKARYKIMKHINVSGAVIIRTNTKTLQKELFATQRAYGDFAGFWEIPGGKIENGETPFECIEREIKEELNANVKAQKILCTIDYEYPTFCLTMHCILCKIKSGKLKLLEHKDAKWLTKDELYSVKWLPADKLLLPKLQDLL